MPRKKMADPEITVPLEFPANGIEEIRAYLRQRPLTSVFEQNVRAFEPASDRARGGQRPGQTQYFPGRAAGNHPIQDLQQLETIATVNTSAIYGQMLYGLASGSGVGLANVQAGVVTSLWTGGASAGYALACSCWDASNNVYVAQVNASTGATRIQAFNLAGAVAWTQTGITVKTSLRGVAGMVAYGPFLYVATVAGSGVCAIQQLNIATGAITNASWAISSTLAAMIFAANSINCLGLCGTMTAATAAIGADCFGTTAANAGLYVFWTNQAGTQLSAQTVAYGAGAQTSRRSTVVSDGTFFYVYASTNTGVIKQITPGTITTAPVINWSSTAADNTAQGMCYDPITQNLYVLCNTQPSLRVLSTVASGALVASTTQTLMPNSGGNGWIDTDSNGFFAIWIDATGLQQLNTTFNITGTTLAASQLSGASMNKGAPYAAATNPRAIKLMLVSNGTVEQFTTAGATALTGATTPTPSAGATRVFSAQVGNDLFYVDGVNYYRYNSQADSMQYWVPNAGSMPVDANGNTGTLLEMWRGRLLIFGLPDQRQNFFATAQLSPLNLNYSPITTSVTEAFAGNASFAGRVGDKLNGMAFYDDNTLVLLCDHTVWQFAGDPEAGGQLDIVSDGLGGCWGRAWAWDEYRQLYFVGSDGQIYQYTPGALPVMISQQIRNRLRNLNLAPTVNIISMAWDRRRACLWLWITPVNGSATTHYCWERRTNAWHPDVYGANAMSPFCIRIIDPDGDNDRQIILGGQDGFVRYVDDSATSDDGTAIVSTVAIGPFKTKEIEEILVKSLHAWLGASSGVVTASVYTDVSADAAAARIIAGSQANAVLTWNAGRNHSGLLRRSGAVCYVVLTASAPWTLEWINLVYENVGKIRSRN